MSWQLYHTTNEAWDAMLADIAAARRSIDLEQYLFANDAVGGRFLAALAERARNGVRVRMVLDGAGSFGMYVASPLKELQDAGAELRFYNPISPWRLHSVLSWYFRDHRKLLVVDGRVGYTGGVCMEAVMDGWRDTHIRLEDPVVGEMAESFERMWERVAADGPRRFPQLRSRSPMFRLLTNSPRFRERYAYHALRAAVRGAQRSVWLTSPYFVPDPRFFRALRRAARRGVDVRILLSGPSDHAWVDLAAHSYFERAFRSGIHIYKYAGRRLHAKTAVIDGAWATVGTLNLDNLSLLFNYEDTIVSTEPSLVAALARQFEEDLGRAPELRRSEWRQRPWTQKVLEQMLRPFHRFL